MSVFKAGLIKKGKEGEALSHTVITFNEVTIDAAERVAVATAKSLGLTPAWVEYAWYQDALNPRMMEW